MSTVERDLEESNAKWSLANWLAWMEPDERSWLWWDADVVDDEHLLVSVAIDSWPFGWGAISWLFRGSGAVECVPIKQMP
jgi:hypothetical protein